MASTAQRAALREIEVREPRRAVSAEKLQRYARDPLAHLREGHVKILDLVTLQPVVFEPYEHQVELARAWIDMELLAATGELVYLNVVETKSRQMGITWILCYLDLWALTYHDLPGLVLHMDFSEVDDGGSGSTVESYFGRIRWMHTEIDARYRAPLIFKMGQIRHAFRASAVLTAEGAGPDPGRGGRYARVVIDEAARLAFGEAAHASLGRACPTGRLYNSTPEGEDNTFARLVKERPANYAVLRHHWTRHPVYVEGLHVAAVRDEDEEGAPQEQPVQPSKQAERVAKRCKLCAGNRAGLRWNPTDPPAHRFPGRLTSPWYDTAVLDLTDDQIAMELEIDFTGSLSARVYPEFDETVHVSELEIAYEPGLDGGNVELAIDYGLDTSSVVVLQEHPSEVRAIAEVEIHDNATPDRVDAELRRILRQKGVPERLLTREWTLRVLAVGDPAGQIREQVKGQTLVGEYRRLGWHVRSRPLPIARTILATKRLLLGRPKPLVISEPDCPLLVEHFKENRWPVDRRGNRKPNAREPENDRHNHMMRALAYYVAYKWPPPEVEGALRTATGPDRGDDPAARRLNSLRRPASTGGRVHHGMKL